nr:hypothetical protein [uncultured Microbacterium sp.]
MTVVTETPAALLPILESRAVVRMDGFSEQADLLPSFAWRAGYALAAADHVLEQLGAPWYRADRGLTAHERWLMELRGGLDTFARICWCLRFGHSSAAIALTRWYIERWTYNVAFSYEVTRIDGEDDASYIQRVWAQYPESMRDADLAERWATLSELLHGRSVRLGSTDIRVDLDLSTYERAKLHNFIVRAAEVPLRQVRGCVSVLADEKHLPTDARAFLLAPVKLFGRAPDPPDFLSVFCRPLDLDYVTSKDAHTVIPWGRTYREVVRRGSKEPLKLSGFHSWMSIEERWVRFADEARTAFEIEARQVGDAFDPTVLRGRLLQYRSITEMTVRASAEIAVPERAEALRAAAAALESAWVLWLQDVDESLISMRCVLESASRARTHRLKPNKAQELEARAAAVTPHRWLEAAGWRRLAPFARALGEFSHMQERSRHAESRTLLTEIQRRPISGFEEQTGRARALLEVAKMLAHETAATLDEFDPFLGSEFRARVLLETDTESEKDLSAWLDRALRFRSHSFGQANYPIPVPDTSLTADDVAQVGVDPPLSSAEPPTTHPA